MKTIQLIIYFLILGIINSQGQELTQTIKGKVSDESSGAGIPYANVVLKNSDPLVGTITDVDGNFKLVKIPVGRYDIEITYLGYEPALMREILITTGKEVFLNVSLRESLVSLGEIKVKPKTNKENPINSMALVSARMLSVEEAKRYAGGFDDPARLASSFAGVASNMANNGIVIRGNAPQMLSWRMEGVEIPNPNHFADMSAFGAGGLTALSSQMLANSDFYTGAFPAEYGNAQSGVFDIFMRTGNNSQHEHTFQIGGIGIDLSSEGPFKKGKKSSYLFNYRYSTLSLLTPLLPEDAGGTNYQDLAYKLNFPTKKAGVFSVWGLGLIDRSGSKAETEPEKRIYSQDIEEGDVKQFMAAGGLTHKIYINTTTSLLTNLAVNGSGLDLFTEILDADLRFYPEKKIKNTNWNLVLSSSINKKFSAKHTNKTGFVATLLNYNLKMQNVFRGGQDLQTVVDNSGNSYLLSAFSSSKFRLSQKLSTTLGVHTQYFTLNNNYTIEPRVGVNWQFTPNQSLGVAYGVHSRLERLNIYFAQNNEGIINNKNLDFSNSHHLVMNYNLSISDNMRFKLEPYIQWLTNVPVEANSSFALINLKDDWFIDKKLENSGKGLNYGVDFTLERFLNKGYYFLLTGSLFDSKYLGGDGKWRNTRYNLNYLFNFLAGKEWPVGKHKQNLFGLNGRISYQGGEKITPINQEASQLLGEVVYVESQAFEENLDAAVHLHFTINYRINKPKHTSVWSFNVINATGIKEFYGYWKELDTGKFVPNEEAIVIPNISYKIEF